MDGEDPTALLERAARLRSRGRRHYRRRRPLLARRRSGSTTSPARLALGLALDRRLGTTLRAWEIDAGLEGLQEVDTTVTPPG